MSIDVSVCMKLTERTKAGNMSYIDAAKHMSHSILRYEKDYNSDCRICNFEKVPEKQIESLESSMKKVKKISKSSKPQAPEPPIDVKETLKELSTWW